MGPRVIWLYSNRRQHCPRTTTLAFRNGEDVACPLSAERPARQPRTHAGSTVREHPRPTTTATRRVSKRRVQTFSRQTVPSCFSSVIVRISLSATAPKLGAPCEMLLRPTIPILSTTISWSMLHRRTSVVTSGGQHRWHQLRHKSSRPYATLSEFRAKSIHSTPTPLLIRAGPT